MFIQAPGEERLCLRVLSSHISPREGAPLRVLHTPNGEAMASKLPELPEVVKGPAHWKKLYAGTSRRQNRWHRDIKSRGWHSMTKQNKLRLSRGQGGRKMTREQAFTTSHPILAAVMLQKPPQMPRRPKGRPRGVITEEPLVISQKIRNCTDKTLFQSRETGGL